MNEQIYTETNQVEKMREEFLRPEELFLLEFLESFDRRANMEWREMGY